MRCRLSPLILLEVIETIALRSCWFLNVIVKSQSGLCEKKRFRRIEEMENKKHFFICFLFGPRGRTEGGSRRGVERRAEGFRPRLSNICWFRREAVCSPKKIEHPLGSEILQPKVYSLEPSWYFGRSL